MIAARWLEIDGLDNIRDVGGLPLRDGGITRSGVLLRSAALQYVPAAAARRLVDELGVRLVLDLRTPGEIERSPSATVAATGVETVALNLVGASRDTLPETGDDTDPLLRNYLGYIADHPANLAEAVRRIADLDGGAALVHCAAGKDRTGVVVAMVLDAVGVERDAVVADYALSAERIEALFRRWAAAEGGDLPADLTVHHPRPDVLATVLRRLDDEHGGAAGWLRENGLDEKTLTRLRARLTDSDRQWGGFTATR